VSRNRTSVPLAPTLMSPPGCCLIPVSVLATFLLISLVGPRPGSFIVADTTIFGVLVIISACGGRSGVRRLRHRPAVAV
jgi:hypothetical protein